ncbi:hypothetical protein BC629DRAFT_1443556 [Irpex lacteus]|nr:hypothetical protein BC629DRAFT_1443556 [Irpex lacteus]
MPAEPGYCEVSCITAFESPTHPDTSKPNTIAIDAHLFGSGGENNTGPLRIRLYNRDDLVFDDQGTLVKADLRIASVFHPTETTSNTFSREEYIGIGDAKSCTIIEGSTVDVTSQYARFVVVGTVEAVQVDPPAFTMQIPQYLAVTGRECRPVLYLRCHLANSKIWKDPKSLLPQMRNGTRIARLNINLDSIEFLLKANSASSTTPTKTEGNPTSPFAKSRFARKTGSQNPLGSTPLSPSPASKRKTPDSPDERSEGGTHDTHPTKSSRTN